MQHTACTHTIHTHLLPHTHNSCQSLSVPTHPYSSQQVHELLQNSNATLNWWFPITNSQFRLSGTLHLLSPSLDTPADTTASSGGTLDNGNNPLPPTLVATDWHQQRLDMFSRLPGALRAGLAAPHAPGTPLEGPAAPGPGAHQSQGALQQEGVRLQLHEQQEGAGGATATQGTPPAAAPVSGPPGGLWGPEEGSWDDAVALEHFGLLVLAVDHVDRVVLGSWPHQRWWYWTTKSADGGADGGVEKGVDGLVWHSQEVQP